MKTIRLNTKLIKSLSDVLFMPAADMMKAAGIPCTTWYAVKNEPKGIKVQQLLAIANGLHIPVRRFFSTDSTDIIGRRDDYITEPYRECSYRAEVLQELVSNRADITWKKASDATGITYDNLRKSLLGDRKTPVVRFLTACEAFGIDPFTVLIDPNPETKRNGSAPRGSATRNNKSIRAEIDSLHKQVADLTAAVHNLTQKYDTLLKSYESLNRRVSYDIHHFTDSNIAIAAEASD